MNEIELYREDGDNLRSVCVRLDEDEFLIDTQDIWPKVDQFWGDRDYEFWTRGPREAWENLFVALAREYLSGDARATDRLREICQKHNVEHRWDSWI